jgi:cytochrome c553
MAAMTPAPTELTERVTRYRPEELFTIVKHGIKFTGMPAWPALPRADEVWAMVAFLLQLPGMQPDAYRALALGELADRQAPGLEGLADPFEPVLAACARCHGRDGRGRGVGAFPILSGQSEAYLFASLQAYARGHRHSGIMQAAAAPLDDAQMRALARHYADAGPLAAADAGIDGPGAAIAQRGVPADGIPACVSCHEPPAGRYPAYPALRGQTPDYLAQQLRLFRDGIRGGTPYAHIMATVARRLSDEQIDAVAAHFGTSPERGPD